VGIRSRILIGSLLVKSTPRSNFSCAAAGPSASAAGMAAPAAARKVRIVRRIHAQRDL